MGERGGIVKSPRIPILLILLFAVLVPLTSARIGYTIVGDLKYILETSYLTEPPLRSLYVEDINAADKYERALEEAKLLHENILKGKIEESTVEETSRITDEITWIDVSSTFQSTFTPLLRHQIMVREHLDAVVEIVLKETGEFLIGKVTLFHRVDETGMKIADQLITDTTTEGFTRWILPILYTDLYEKDTALLSVESFLRNVEITVDDEMLPFSPYYFLTPGEHEIHVSAPYTYPKDIKLNLEGGTYYAIEDDLEPIVNPGLLLKGSGQVRVSGAAVKHLPFIVKETPLPITLQAGKQSYLDENITLTEPREELTIALKRIEFDPAVTVSRVQKTFYSSLARTMLLFASARIVEIATENNEPVVSQILDGLSFISAGDTVRSLFDYYNKSKYSVSMPNLDE